MEWTSRPSLQTVDNLHRLLHRAAQIDRHVAGLAGVVPVSMAEPAQFRAAAVSGMTAMAEAMGIGLERFGYAPGDLPDPEL